jgi:hypothetical protein
VIQIHKRVGSLVAVAHNQKREISKYLVEFTRHNLCQLSFVDSSDEEPSSIFNQYFNVARSVFIEASLFEILMILLNSCHSVVN